MKFALLAVIAAATLIGAATNEPYAHTRLVDLSSNVDVLNAFNDFAVFYRRQYATDEEAAIRLANFRRNLEIIQTHNAGNHPYFLRMNHFGDLSKAEYLAMLRPIHADLPIEITTPSTPVEQPSLADPLNPSNPKAVHWEKQGGVTPVKDQGQCGSCWAFSTTGSIETAAFIATGKLVSLSEQQLLDCSNSYGNMGCDGGDMGPSMQYVIDTKYIDTEAAYPYLEWQQKTCKASPATAGASISSYINITSGCDTCLENAAVNGSVSVAIDASSDDFQFYGGGIFEIAGCSRTELDHGVLVVGYDELRESAKVSTPYWWVKNSWSSDWGDYGYIKMRKAKTPSDEWKNMCGICTMATQPRV